MFKYFYFNGKDSRDFDLKIGHVGSSSSNPTSSTSYENNYAKMKNSNGFKLVSSVHNNPIALDNISVVRDGCNNKYDYSYDEMKDILDWLTSTKSGLLKIVLDDGSSEYLTGMFYEITEKVLNGESIGYDLKFKADSPYVMGDTVTSKFTNMKIVNVDIPRHNYADQNYLYPVMDFTVQEAGDLYIYMSVAGVQNDDSTVLIKNCILGEIIHVDSLNEIITSSNNTDLYKRFNWVFPYFICDKSKLKSSTFNTVTFTKPVNGTIKYTPLMIGVGIFG